MLVTELIARDHRAVHDLFLELDAMSPADAEARRALFSRIVGELQLHSRAEEEVVYPAVRAASRRIDDAEAGHQHLRNVISEVEVLDADSAEFAAGVRLVQHIVLNHVMEEESGIFLDAERMGGEELERLGEAFAQRKAALTDEGRRAA
jgi:hemerythrin superfamily protein